MNYPKHEEFLKKYISIGAKFVDEFNKTHKIKGQLSLNPEENMAQVSINTEKTDNKNVKITNSLVENNSQNNSNIQHNNYYKNNWFRIHPSFLHLDQYQRILDCLLILSYKKHQLSLFLV